MTLPLGQGFLRERKNVSVYVIRNSEGKFYIG